jgi:hypothetical protein
MDHENQDTAEALKSSPVAEFAAGAVGIEMETEPKSDPVSDLAHGVEAMSGNRPRSLELSADIGARMDQLKQKERAEVEAYFEALRRKQEAKWRKQAQKDLRGNGETLSGRRPVKEVIAALILLALALCIAFAVCTMVGCYAPDLTNTHYSCVEAAPLCPENQKCINGCCGGGPCKGAPTMPQTDMGGMAAADMTSPITYNWDPAMNPVKLSQCPSGYGYPISATIVLCRIIDQGNPPCLGNWRLADANPIPASECRKIPWGRFFGSPHGLSGIPPTTIAWTWNNPQQGTIRYIAACGRPDAPGSYSVNLTQGYDMVASCKQGTASDPATSLHCPASGVPGDGDFASVWGDRSFADGSICVMP